MVWHETDAVGQRRTVYLVLFWTNANILEHTFDDGIKNEHPWFQIGWEQIGKYSKQTSFYKLLNADLCVSSFHAFVRHLVFQKEADLDHKFHEIQHFDMIRYALDLYSFLRAATESYDTVTETNPVWYFKRGRRCIQAWWYCKAETRVENDYSNWNKCKFFLFIES